MELTFWTVVLVIIVTVMFTRGLPLALGVLLVATLLYVVWHGLYVILALIGVGFLAYSFFAKTEIGQTIWRKVGS